MNLLIKGIYTLIIAFVLCIFVCPVQHLAVRGMRHSEDRRDYL